MKRFGKDKFVLACCKRNYSQADKFPKVRINLNTYSILERWAAESQIPMDKLIEMAVMFADEQLVYIK